MGERPDALAGEYTERDLADDTHRAADADAVPEAEYIEVEIDQTRAEMTDTIDAIGERLSPANVVGQAREATIGKVENMVSDATYRAQDAGSGIAETIRSNPLPAALAGIGIGWLIVRGRQGSSTSRASYRTNTWATDDAGFGQTERGGQAEPREFAAEAGERIGDVAGRAGERVGDAADRATERVGDVAGRAQQRVGDVAAVAQDRATQVASQARSQAERARGQVDRLLQESPLAVAAVAAAVGAGVGMALPPTRKEQEIMGDARERVLDKAQHAAEQTMDRVQATAGGGNGSRGGS